MQCSYNANFRGRYPSVGWSYDSSKDVFKSPKPFPSWVWNDTDFKWDAPVPVPGSDRPHVKWDEDTKTWVDNNIEGDDEWIANTGTG